MSTTESSDEEQDSFDMLEILIILMAYYAA